MKTFTYLTFLFCLISFAQSPKNVPLGPSNNYDQTSDLEKEMLTATDVKVYFNNNTLVTIVKPQYKPPKSITIDYQEEQILSAKFDNNLSVPNSWESGTYSVTYGLRDGNTVTKQVLKNNNSKMSVSDIKVFFENNTLVTIVKPQYKPPKTITIDYQTVQILSAKFDDHLSVPNTFETGLYFVNYGFADGNTVTKKVQKNNNSKMSVSDIKVYFENNTLVTIVKPQYKPPKTITVDYQTEQILSAKFDNNLSVPNSWESGTYSVTYGLRDGNTVTKQVLKNNNSKMSVSDIKVYFDSNTLVTIVKPQYKPPKTITVDYQTEQILSAKFDNNLSVPNSWESGTYSVTYGLRDGNTVTKQVLKNNNSKMSVSDIKVYFDSNTLVTIVKPQYKPPKTITVDYQTEQILSAKFDNNLSVPNSWESGTYSVTYGLRDGNTVTKQVLKNNNSKMSVSDIKVYFENNTLVTIVKPQYKPPKTITVDYQTEQILSAKFDNNLSVPNSWESGMYSVTYGLRDGNTVTKQVQKNNNSKMSVSDIKVFFENNTLVTIVKPQYKPPKTITIDYQTEQILSAKFDDHLSVPNTFETGLYFVNYGFADGNTVTKKVVKNNTYKISVSDIKAYFDNNTLVTIVKAKVKPPTTISIHDLSGGQILSDTFKNYLNVPNNMKTGVCIVTYGFADGNTVTKKIIKNN